ncbi:MAG: hypothetical protein H6672_08525 [Anaerolineaceae bacterium]|nr:hypothetical protein [Anaerolineaceae bacterium]
MKTDAQQPNPLHTDTNLVEVAQTLLRIVAHLGKTQYTDARSTQVVVQQADEFPPADLSDPASEYGTSQG